MGNKAVIATEKKDIGVYLHWNGGRDSVEPFLAYCKLKGYRAPETDCYGWARLCQVIGNFFGGSASIGIDKYECLDTDNHDNGTYIIKGWEIVGREFQRGGEQSNYTLNEMLMDIDKSQPESEQLGEEFLNAEIVNARDLKIGDQVYIQTFSGAIEKHIVVGQVTTQSVLRGEHKDTRQNGHNILNKFYIDKYPTVCDRININNFLLQSEYRVIR